MFEITTKGRMFIDDGGYVANKIKQKIKSMLAWIAAGASVVAVIVGIIQLLKK